jgi:hypothetical protein
MEFYFIIILFDSNMLAVILFLYSFEYLYRDLGLYKLVEMEIRESFEGVVG